MTKEQVKAILDRVLTWPEDRQEDVARILLAMEEQDNNSYQLTHEQIAEIKRRMEEENPETLTLEEFRKSLSRFGV